MCRMAPIVSRPKNDRRYLLMALASAQHAHNIRLLQLYLQNTLNRKLQQAKHQSICAYTTQYWKCKCKHRMPCHVQTFASNDGSLLVRVNISPKTQTSSKRIVAHSKRYIFQHVPTAGKPAAAAQAGVACLWHDFCKKYRPNTSIIHPMRIRPTIGAMVAMFLAGSVIVSVITKIAERNVSADSQVRR